MGKLKISRWLALVVLACAGCGAEDTDRLAKIGRILADRTGQVVEKVKDDFSDTNPRAWGNRKPAGPETIDWDE